MKYCIVKPKTHELDKNLVERIKMRDKDVVFVNGMSEADSVIFQKGWISSTVCTKKWKKAKLAGMNVLEEASV